MRVITNVDCLQRFFPHLRNLEVVVGRNTDNRNQKSSKVDRSKGIAKY